MKGIFWVRDESDEAASNQRETNLSAAVKDGAKRHGHEIEVRVKGKDGDLSVPKVSRAECDVVLACGVKNRELFRAATAEGVNYCYFDKGYERKRDTNTLRGWLEFWRVTVNGHQPEAYVARARHDRSRADEMGYSLKERRTSGKCVLVDGSSAKHWWFHSEAPVLDKRQMDEYANRKVHELVREVRSLTNRPIILRPKQSWHRAKDPHISGVEFVMGRKDPSYDLQRSHCVITYGSNLCFDAVISGIPAIVIGDGIARSVSSTSLLDIENPHWASEQERRQWLNNCAWCQFKLDEFRSGMGWEVIKEMVEGSHG